MVGKGVLILAWLVIAIGLSDLIAARHVVVELAAQQVRELVNVEAGRK